MALASCGLAWAAAYSTPFGQHLLPTALLDGADPTNCVALSEITATTSWCVKSCGGSPSICPPDLCSCASSTKAVLGASASAASTTLFVNPDLGVWTLGL